MITVAIIAILFVWLGPLVPELRHADQAGRRRSTSCRPGSPTVAGLPTHPQLYDLRRDLGHGRPSPPRRQISLSRSGANATTFTASAVGRTGLPADGFNFTINQAGQRATATAPSGWPTNSSCWVRDKAGSCTETAKGFSLVEVLVTLTVLGLPDGVGRTSHQHGLQNARAREAVKPRGARLQLGARHGGQRTEHGEHDAHGGLLVDDHGQRHHRCQPQHDASQLAGAGPRPDLHGRLSQLCLAGHFNFDATGTGQCLVHHAVHADLRNSWRIQVLSSGVDADRNRSAMMTSRARLPRQTQRRQTGVGIIQRPDRDAEFSLGLMAWQAPTRG